MKKILLLMLVLITSLLNNVYAQFDVYENLLLYLNFDDAVLTENEQEVAATGCTAVATAGKFGKAAMFDGTQYIAMTPIPAYDPHTKAIAFSYWMKTGVTTGEDIFVYNQMTDPTGTDLPGRIAMALRFDDKLGADIGWVGGNLESDPGTDNVSGLASDNNWHHIVAAFNVLGTSINLYIDGVLVDEITTSGMGEIVAGEDFDFTNFLLFLGMGAADYPGFELGWAPTFTGSIDEFRIYQTDDQLTSADVDVLYNFKPQATSQFDVDANLLLYLNFDGAAITDNEQEVPPTNATASVGSGKFGKASVFDGSQYIAMSPISDYDPRTKSVSFSFWMKTGVTTGEDIFVYNPMTDPTGTDTQGRLAVSLRYDDKMGADIGWVGGNLEGDPGPDNTPGLVSDNNWHHVVVSFLQNGVGMNIYIDKILVDEISTGGAIGEEVAGEDWDFTNSLLFLGMGAADYPGFELGWAPTFTGSIDEFRMFQTDEPLTIADVADLYNYIPPIVDGKHILQNDPQLIKIYPNPATDFIQIQSVEDNISVQVMNSLGQKVMSVTNNKHISTNSLRNGIYIVKVTAGNVTNTQKILVNK